MPSVKRFDTNAVGDRGESLFRLAVTSFHGLKPLFRPAALGDKWPVADFAVELVGHPGYFFLVQVKSTRRSLTKRKRLPIKVGRGKFNSLVSAQIPAYLIGVHEPGEKIYITAAVTRRSTDVSSVTTKHSLTRRAVRKKLFDEVKRFWSVVRSNRLWQTSEFKG